LLVSFSEDPGWWHERLILHHITHGESARFVILSPDGDLYDESVKDWESSYVISGKGAYPAGLEEGSFVQFDAPVEMRELIGFHREAADYAAEVWTSEGLTPLSKVTSAVGWDGRVNRIFNSRLTSPWSTMTWMSLRSMRGRRMLWTWRLWAGMPDQGAVG
jgi:hypothetical protein